MPRPDPTQVLILDSDRSSAMRCRSELRAAGLDATWCGNVERALQRLSDSPVAALVVHLDAREVDGLSLVSAVRAHASTAALPILAVTAGYDDAIRDLALQHGCDGLLAGGDEPSSLVGLLRNFMLQPPPRAA